MNYIKTIALLVLLSALFMWVGGAIGGREGMLTAFIFSLLVNAGAYWFSDKIVLAMYGAQELKEDTFPEIHRIVRELARKDNIPAPKIYIAPIDAPNAFATGRSPGHSAVCVTRGMLNLLGQGDLKGVIAHEMSHIKNRDTLIMTLVASVASAVMMLANMARWAAIFGGRDDREKSGGIIGILAVSIIAPLAAMLIQLAISRSREYAADESGARLAGTGMGLAAALAKLDAAAKHYDFNAGPQTAHLFIVNPLGGNFIADLFRTHPPTEKRIERLKRFIA